MSIQLDTAQTLIRYISEWDPREAAHTKGGYLEGMIEVPNISGKIVMQIQTYPAEDVDPLISQVHPVLLHCVRIGKGKRDQELEPVPTYHHWKQVFEIENDEVKILNKTTELDVEKDGRVRNVPLKDTVTKLISNRITLGRKRGQLNLILLQPKQKSRAQEAEASVTKVLNDRLGGTEDTPMENYEKLFKGKNVKNLKRLRLKIDFFTEDFHCSAISTRTIVDTGNKDIGAMDFIDAHPLLSCVKGNRTIMMVSEYSLSKDVVPIFQIFTIDPIHQSEVHRVDLDHFLVQPEEVKEDSCIEVMDVHIIFRSPAQPRLELVTEPFAIKLAVKRNGDSNICSKKFNFKYIEHKGEDQCIMCCFPIT